MRMKPAAEAVRPAPARPGKKSICPSGSLYDQGGRSNMKKIFTLALALILALSVIGTAFAAAPGVWTVPGHGIMTGRSTYNASNMSVNVTTTIEDSSGLYLRNGIQMVIPDVPTGITYENGNVGQSNLNSVFTVYISFGYEPTGATCYHVAVIGPTVEYAYTTSVTF